ncbi:hypothetical protein WICMUC_003753 [Wickerhamomyces mucosus]|uniref:asparaginase n=1 Tax=Wickerhamomyces mucosus TaxID=1378264 RepID=A0A9P8TBD6_9ASCO|nr:hypothetical protein WICMUC_003753 [Wickerhamomyces mucosus]
MKLNTILLTSSLILGAQSLPLFERWFGSSDSEEIDSELFPVFNKDSNGTAVNGTSGGNSTFSNTTSSSTSTVKLFSFSSNFTALYNESFSVQSQGLTEVSNSSSLQLSLAEFLASQVSDATIVYEQINSTSPSNFSSSNLIELHQAIQSAEAEGVEGIVVLQDDDFLSESAFFLESTLNFTTSNTTIVLAPIFTVLEIPSTGVGNLIDSLQVASDSQKPDGATSFVVVDEYIYSGFYFDSDDTNGLVGFVSDEDVEWLYSEIKPLELSTSNITLAEAFSDANATTLPEIITLSITKNFNVDILSSITSTNIEGVVLQVPSLSILSDDALSGLGDEKIPVVLASSGFGASSSDLPDNVYTAGLLNADQAGVVLQVALASGLKGDELSELFESVYGA